jgi:hypothetical protein
MHAPTGTESAPVHHRCRDTTSRMFAALAERDSKPPANPRESYRSSIVRPGLCGIIRCASKDMHEAQHSPSIVQRPFLFFGELPRRPDAVGAPRRVLESITNFTARYAWANLIEASSVFRVSAGARLCRITPPRNSSGCCHSAGIRHDPRFGITTQVERRDVLQTHPFTTDPNHVPDYILRDTVPSNLPRPGDCTEYPSLPDTSRSRPLIESRLDPFWDGYGADVPALAD